MRSEIELRCILFPLIILEMFLQLDWCPPVVNSIDWIWFGKDLTWLCKVPHLTVHVRAKNKPWGPRHCPKGSDTGLCRGTDLGKGTKKCLQHWTSPRTQWPPSFLNGRSLKPPRLFLELATWPNWAIGGGPWSGDQESDAHSDRAPEFLCGDGRTIQKDNHLCSTPPIRPLW